MPGRRLLVLPLAIALAWFAPSRAGALGGWSWPVVGPVIRGFEPPSSPYGAGHRGIDIAAAVGTPVRAPAPGIVSFAGPVGGELFVSVDHGGGLVSTYSWVSSVLVRKGDTVGEGSVVALSGNGHVGVSPAHLHFGVKLDGAYVDPMGFLAPASVVALIRLAPVPPGFT
jgi:murein DD-endopeptidase MepM/ murein hydrolase activator NlpD